jgi:hypothetical protein
MFNLIKKLTRSRNTADSTSPAPRRPALEPLEDRRLYSVSTLSAVQQPVSPSLPAVPLPAVQQPARTNIIAILIGL